MSQEATKVSTEVSQQSRRTFLGTLGWIFTGLIALVMSAAGGIYAIYPAFSSGRNREDLWQAITALDQIPEGKPTRYTFGLVERAGWAETSTQQAVWVVRRGQTIDVFSAICPHEGCTLDHDPKGFICHCHLSQWRDDGVKVSGPTPRGLDRLSYRVTNNQLEIKYQNFKRGTEQQIPMA